MAVIDEPVQTTHPDLKANIWSNPKNSQEHGYNFWDNSSELDWRTVGGDAQSPEYADHGTHVAGIIAAVNNNSRGIAGIAGGRNNSGGVRIMSCQIMGNSSGANKGNPIVKAFEYAWTNGAIIAQNSWGYSLTNVNGEKITPEQFEQEWESNYGIIRDAIDTFIRGAGTKNPNSPLRGGLVIFAAGNDGDIYGDARRYPAAYDAVIAVGAMDWSFRPAYYSDYGSWVDITAPGGDIYTSGPQDGYGMILSTILCDDAINFQGGPRSGYGFMQGTSMACPHMSGVAALGLSYALKQGKHYTRNEFISMLLTSVNDMERYLDGTKESNGTMYLENYRKQLGTGAVDAYQLLMQIEGTPCLKVGVGAEELVPLTQFFGGSATNLTYTGVSMSAADMAKLGIETLPTMAYGKLKIKCTKSGVAKITVTAIGGGDKVGTGTVMGGMTITKEFAIIARGVQAGNGGWL